LIVEQATFGQLKYCGCGDIIFNATFLEVSEKLALTLCASNECVESNRVRYRVRVGAFASFNLDEVEAN
jgi:hypothetical protein